jgi:2-dehydropantoate 2-reductase
MKEPKSAVVGAGAIGGCVAADLAKAGHDVTIIDGWAAHVEAIRANGLTVETAAESCTTRIEAMHVGDVAAIRDQFDVVFVGVKPYDTRWAVELIHRHVHPDGLVVGLQNSLCDEDIASIVGTGRTIGCVVELGAEVFEPARIVRRTPPSTTWFGIGALDPSMQHRCAQVARLLGAGARVSVLADIQSGKWTKLVVNSILLGPTAILDANIAQAFKMPGMDELSTLLAREAIEVGMALGRSLQPLFGLKEEDLSGSPEKVVETLITTLRGHIDKGTRTAVLQDQLKGRYTEVNAINGLMVELARRGGVHAPYNQLVVDITDRIWQGAAKPGPGQMSALLGR